MNEYIIEFLSFEWTRNFITTFFLISFFLFVGKLFNKKQNLIVAKSFSISLLVVTITSHYGNIESNQWSLKEHLPLHLCSINSLICISILFLPKIKSLYEFNFYGGVLGGTVAILTPQINDYDGSNLEYLIYYLSHGLIILIPLYLFYYLNYELRKLSWLRTLFFLNILMIILIPLNKYLQSNYMYVNEPPKVDNPLIIGDWPIYLINLELIIVLLFSITYFIFTKVSLFKPKKI